MKSKSFLGFFFDVIIPLIIMSLFIWGIFFIIVGSLISANEKNKKDQSLVEQSRREDLSEEEFDSLSTDNKLKVLYLNKSN